VFTVVCSGFHCIYLDAADNRTICPWCNVRAHHCGFNDLTPAIVADVSFQTYVYIATKWHFTPFTSKKKSYERNLLDGRERDVRTTYICQAVDRQISDKATYIL
jgi:hypothetical protein